MKGKLLGLTGDPQVGKDTLAELLIAEHGYVRAAFADPLYLEVADAFGVTVEQLRSVQWKTHAQPELSPIRSSSVDFIKVCNSLGLFADEALSSRRVLQIWSTEYKRKMYGEDYWVGQMIEHLGKMDEVNIVFTDLRFDVEACMGHWLVSRDKAESFTVIRILRAGSIASTHDSDRGLSKFLIDGVVRNNTIPSECLADLLTILSDLESKTNG